MVAMPIPDLNALNWNPREKQAYQYGDQYAQYGMHPDDHVTSCGGSKLSGVYEI